MTNNTTLDHSVGLQITLTDTNPNTLREAGRLMAQLPPETVINISEVDTRGDESNHGDWEPWQLCGWLEKVLLCDDATMPRGPMTIQAQTSTYHRKEVEWIVSLIERMPGEALIDAEYPHEEDPDGENSAYESVGDIDPKDIRNVLSCFLPEEQTTTTEG